MDAKEFLDKTDFEKEGPVGRFRLLSYVLTNGGDEEYVKSKMTNADWDFSEGKTTDNGLTAKDISENKNFLNGYGAKPLALEAGVDGFLRGVDRSGVSSIASLVKPLFESEGDTAVRKHQEEINKTILDYRNQDSDGAYQAGQFVGAAMPDVPAYLAGSPIASAAAVGVLEGATTAREQNDETRDRDWGEIAASTVGGGVGAFTGMKAGKFVAKVSPIFKPLAAAVTDSAIQTGTLNASEYGYNTVFGNEDRDRERKVAEDLFGSFIGYGIPEAARALREIPKVIKGAPAGVRSVIKTIPEAVREARASAKIKNENMTLENPEVKAMLEKDPSKFTPEDIGILRTSMDRLDIKAGVPSPNGTMRVIDGLEKFTPVELPVVRGNFSDSAYKAGIAYENMLDARKGTSLKAIRKAEREYKNALIQNPNDSKAIGKLTKAIDEGATLKGARHDGKNILRETKIEHVETDPVADDLRAYEIMKAQHILGKAVNAQKKKAFAATELLRPSTWKAAYSRQEVPILKKLRTETTRAGLDRSESVNRYVADAVKLSGAKSLNSAPPWVKIFKARLDRAAAGNATVMQYLHKAESRWGAAMKDIRSSKGTEYVRKVTEVAETFGTALRLYNLAKMGGAEGRLPKGITLARLESMIGGMKAIFAKEGVEGEHVFRVFREMENNAKEIRGILYDSGALSPEVLQKWERSGLYIPLSHDLMASPDINKALSDTIDQEMKRFKTSDNLWHLSKTQQYLNIDYGKQITESYTAAVAVSNRYMLMTALADMNLQVVKKIGVGKVEEKAAAEAAHLRNLFAIHKEQFEAGVPAKEIIDLHRADLGPSDMKRINQISNQFKAGGKEGYERYVHGLETKGINVAALHSQSVSPVRTDKADQEIHIYRPDGNGQDNVIYVSRRFLDDLLQTDSSFMDKTTQILSNICLVRPLRASATVLNPAFAAVNTARDVWHMAMTDSAGVLTDNRKILPLATSLFHLVAYDGRRGADGDIVGNSIAQILYKKVFKPEEYKRVVDNFVENGGARMGSIEQFNNVSDKRSFGATHIMEKIVGAIEFSERVTRMAMNEKARKVLPERWNEYVKNGTWEEADFHEAMGHIGELSAWTAAKAIDFSQGGSLTRLVSGIVPYLNAGVQSQRTFLRSAGEDPALFAFKLGEFMAAVTAISVWNAMCPGYEDAVPQDKASGFNICLPWLQRDAGGGEMRTSFIWLPLPQELQPFKAFTEAIVVAHNRGLDTKAIAQAMSNAIPVSPSAVSPITSAWMALVCNYDTFYGDKVWKGSSDTLPGQQISNDTHALYRWLGSEMPGVVSPVRLERAVSAIIPSSNSVMAAAMYSSDYVAETLGMMPEDNRNTLLTGLAKSLGVGRFMRETKPSYWAYNEARQVALDKQREIGDAVDVGRQYGRLYGAAQSAGDMSKAQDAYAAMLADMDRRGFSNSPGKMVAAMRSFRGSRANKIDQQNKILKPYYQKAAEEFEE